MTPRGLRIVTDQTAVDGAGCPGAEPRDGVGAGETAGAATTVGSTVSVPAVLLRLAPTAQERRWTADALCSSGDPDRLFVTGAAQREAAKLCRDCPVRMPCLADALDNRVEFGVWGGMTERQRRALLKRRPDVASWRAVLERARQDARRGVAS